MGSSFLPVQLCVILEPMQELMSKHKAHHLAPRDCLKTTLFHKWQRMIAPTPGKQPRARAPAPTSTFSMLPVPRPNQAIHQQPDFSHVTDAQRPPNKRRKRKGSNSAGGANNVPPVASKKRSPGPNFSLASQVVVQRGLPSTHSLIFNWFLEIIAIL